jgi:hypothetical protein
MLIRHRGDEDWHRPAVEGFDVERLIKELLEATPEVLPWIKPRPVATATELHVAGFGKADLVIIDRSGALAIVECKLEANDEYRRYVIGQVFEYAAGMTGLTYDELDMAWERTTSSHISAAFDAIAGEDWNEKAFIAKVTANLEAGRFHLVVAVDKMKTELERTITYINQHSQGDFVLLGLELEYVRDGEVEVLTPKIHGSESANQSRVRNRQRNSEEWDEPRFFAALAESASDGVAAVREVVDWSKDHGLEVEPDGPRLRFAMPGASHSLLKIHTNGTVRLRLDLPKAISEEEGGRIKAFARKRLDAIEGLHLRVGGDFTITRLKDASRRTKFLEALDSVLGAVDEATRVGHSAAPLDEGDLGLANVDSVKKAADIQSP